MKIFAVYLHLAPNSDTYAQSWSIVAVRSLFLCFSFFSFCLSILNFSRISSQNCCDYCSTFSLCSSICLLLRKEARISCSCSLMCWNFSTKISGFFAERPSKSSLKVENIRSFSYLMHASSSTTCTWFSSNREVY